MEHPNSGLLTEQQIEEMNFVKNQHKIYACFTGDLTWFNVNTSNQIKKAKIFFQE